MDEQLIAFGGEIKALDGNRVGGYLVRFTDADNPDLTGDYFTKDTDFDIEDGQSMTVYYHHGQNKTLGNRKLGRGKLRLDDVGVWIEAELEMRDDYERAIGEQLVMAGKAGWSSGAVAHLVNREAGKKRRVGNNSLADWRGKHHPHPRRRNFPNTGNDAEKFRPRDRHPRGTGGCDGPCNGLNRFSSRTIY